MKIPRGYLRLIRRKNMKKLELNELACIRGGLPLFRELSISVNPGHTLYVQGPNGCGKSSLLKIIAGLLEPARGSVSFGSRSLMPEDFVFLDHKIFFKAYLTLSENLLFWAEIIGASQIRLQKGLQELGLNRFI